jgi:hypothetical protein
MRRFYTRRLAKEEFDAIYVRIAALLHLASVAYAMYASTVMGFFTQLFMDGLYRVASTQ